MFPRLIEAGRLHDIHVAWDKEGNAVGATVAALHKDGEEASPMHDALAWPDTLGNSFILTPINPLQGLELTAGRVSLRDHCLCRRSSIYPRIRRWDCNGSLGDPEPDRSRRRRLFYRLGGYGRVLPKVRISAMGKSVSWSLEVSFPPKSLVRSI